MTDNLIVSRWFWSGKQKGRSNSNLYLKHQDDVEMLTYRIKI